MNVYPVGLAQLMSGSVGWESSVVRAALLTESYQFSSTDVMLDDILASRVVAVSDELEDPSEEGGVFGGSPFRFAPFLDGRTVAQAVVFLDAGDPAYSVLIANWSTEDLIGAPFSPQGLEYFIHPDAALGGFFQVIDDPLIGPLNTHPLGVPLALGGVQGGLQIVGPPLVLSAVLSLGDRVCVPADEADSCCEPVFRGSICE